MNNEALIKRYDNDKLLQVLIRQSPKSVIVTDISKNGVKFAVPADETMSTNDDDFLVSSWCSEFAGYYTVTPQLLRVIDDCRNFLRSPYPTQAFSVSTWAVPEWEGNEDVIDPEYACMKVYEDSVFLALNSRNGNTTYEVEVLARIAERILELENNKKTNHEQ